MSPPVAPPPARWTTPSAALRSGSTGWSCCRQLELRILTMKWEYMTLMLPASGLILGGKIDAQKLTDRLNQLGGEGWELVSVFDTNMLEGKTREVFAVLKRRLQ